MLIKWFWKSAQNWCGAFLTLNNVTHLSSSPQLYEVFYVIVSVLVLNIQKENKVVDQLVNTANDLAKATYFLQELVELKLELVLDLYLPGGKNTKQMNVNTALSLQRMYAKMYIHCYISVS